MIWLALGLLVVVAFALLTLVFRAPRRGWELLGAALLFGMAGYAVQGRPGLPSAPSAPPESKAGNPQALVEARRQLAGKDIPGVNRWLVIGDALARNGQYADAAEVLLGATEHDAKNSDAWLALANALVSHAEGTLTPPALYAYRRAALADPQSPGPPFFLGLALAQSGRLDEGRALWAQVLARSPKDAPWRADLEQRLQRLDAFIAAQRAARPMAGQ
jgi:cytochrome c-type biogenesis protein CcmH